MNITEEEKKIHKNMTEVLCKKCAEDKMPKEDIEMCEKRCEDDKNRKLTNCLCKNGQCKKNSGCGTNRKGWFRKCSHCTKNNCEDEGRCKWRKGKCVPKDEPSSPKNGQCKKNSGCGTNRK